ncbi:SRPBCC family protein [Streptomyces desertarenae]|uniref:SRPBCC family protein n=2 Tax=Streptomyces TaxID=1883 RepID=A0ABW4PEQ7_9ACTN
MPQVRVYVSIPLPVEEVFGYLADGCNLAAWHSGAMSVRPAWPGGPGGEGGDGEGGGPGAVYRYRFPGRRRECVLRRVVHEPPSRVSFAGQRMWTPLGCQVPRFDFRLWPWEGGGCRVEVGVDCSLGGAMLLLWPVVAFGWRRDLPADARALYERLAGAGGQEEAQAAVTEARRTAGGGPTGRDPQRSPAGAAGPGTGPGIGTEPGFGTVEPAWRRAAPAPEPARPSRPVRRFRLPALHG